MSQSKESEIKKIKSLIEKYQEESNQLDIVIDALKEKECSLIRELPNIFASDKVLRQAWREFHGHDEGSKQLDFVKEIIFEHFGERENLKITNFLMVGLDDRACDIRIMYKDKSFSKRVHLTYTISAMENTLFVTNRVSVHG